MNILLDGYFDKNFGDDIMQLLVVRGLKKHKIYVTCPQREMLAHLEDEENVIFTDSLPDTDVYLNVIGTGFGFNGKRAVAEKIIRMLTSKKIKYPKKAVVDCSIEPFSGKISGCFTKQELCSYDFISCRDLDSYSFIKKHCKNSETAFHADVVFTLAERLKKSVASEGFLGAAPVRRIYGSTNYGYYKSLAECCDYYVEKTGNGVLLFAFDSGIENDISAAMSVKRMMKNSESVQIIAYNSDPDDFIKNFQRCSAFIGSRFHSVVLALCCGIPVCSVYDTAKLKHLSTMLNIPMISREEAASEGLCKMLSELKEPISLPENISSDANGHIEELFRFLEK